MIAWLNQNAALIVVVLCTFAVPTLLALAWFMDGRTEKRERRREERLEALQNGTSWLDEIELPRLNAWIGDEGSEVVRPVGAEYGGTRLP